MKKFNDIEPSLIEALNNTITVLVGEEYYSKPSYQLTEAVWGKYAEIMKSLGGRYVSKDKGFKFKEDISGIIQKIADEGEFKFNLFDFYPTPAELVDLCLDLLNITDYTFQAKILEPNGGTGAFISRIPEDATITSYELDKSLAKNLIAKFPNINLLNEDFLTSTPEPIYDYVIMNPPFNSEEKKNIWIQHIEHAKKFLKKNGKLLSIVPASFATGNTKEIKNFRNEMLNYGYYVSHDIEFSTTKVKTVVLVYENVDISQLPKVNGYGNFSIFQFFVNIDSDRDSVEKIVKLCKNYNEKEAEELLSSLVEELRKREEWIIYDENLKNAFYKHVREYETA